MTGPDARLAEAARLLEGGRVGEAAEAAGALVRDVPGWSAAWNLRATALFMAGSPAEAAAAFERAAALAPDDPEPARNLVQVRLALGEADPARLAADRLLALVPGEAEAHRLAGAACALAGDAAGAERALRQAVRLDPGAVQGWLDLAGLLARSGRVSDALEALEAASQNSAARSLAEARMALALRLVEQAQGKGWAGTGEGAALQAAHDAIVGVLDAGVPAEQAPWAAGAILARLLDHEAHDRLGSFEALGRRFAEAGERRPLLIQLGRAPPTHEGRAEALAQHVLWGRTVSAAAARRPASARLSRSAGSRIALGLLSSDLRAHVVGTFAWPLFEHLDPERFDLFVYSSMPGPPDAFQAEIAARVRAFRHEPGASAARIAEIAAADGLDMAIEIGGLTNWNPVEALCWRIAPIQASWLGYPQSVGLPEIDHIVLDPWLVPPDPALLAEQPLLMPRSWIAMGGRFFPDDPPAAPDPPSLANGFVTFGTANAAYKMSRPCLDLWARVLAAVPGSRFLVVRPEAGAPSFRGNMLAAFAARGVAPDRILFEPVRGGHLPHYGRMDISLDTVPVTGGTTTCESLWMGVPVVSLVGGALYERLSYSLLNNVGLGDLAVGDADAYVEVAATLAADIERRRSLRGDLRTRIRNGVLGDTRGFARDFYDLVARTVAAA